MASQSLKLHGCVGAFFRFFFNVLFRDLERSLAGVRCVAWCNRTLFSNRAVV